MSSSPHPRPHHALQPTTHTLDMAQIAEINRRLTRGETVAPSAAQLGLAGTATRRGSASAHLSPGSVLSTVSWDGDPEFPDIFGHFTGVTGAAPSDTVQLHTAALRELSAHLRLRQHWGVEPG